MLPLIKNCEFILFPMQRWNLMLSLFYDKLDQNSLMRDITRDSEITPFFLMSTFTIVLSLSRSSSAYLLTIILIIAIRHTLLDIHT